MTTDIFQGDPLITLDEDGADMVFVSGNPIMDQGYINQVNFSIFTESGHWTEDLERNANKRYKGLFLKAAKKPITRQSLIDDARALEADLQSPAFRTVQAEVVNPKYNGIDAEVTYTPPSNQREKLRLTRQGKNWISQIDNPVNDYLNEA